MAAAKHEDTSQETMATDAAPTTTEVLEEKLERSPTQVTKPGAGDAVEPAQVAAGEESQQARAPADARPAAKEFKEGGYGWCVAYSRSLSGCLLSALKSSQY
jgi:hypothetical protein